MPKFIDYIFNHRHYKEVLSAYKEATQRLNKAFEVWQTTINRELTDDYSTQEFIFENISSIRDIQSWMDKTHNLLSSKKQAVLWLYSDTYGRSTIPELTYEEYKFIATNSSKINHYDSIISLYRKILSNNKNAVARFLGVSTSEHTFSQIHRIAHSEADIVKITKTIERATKCLNDYPLAWRQFSRNRPISDIPLSELETIVPDDFGTKNHFLWLYHKNQNIINLILGTSCHPVDSFDKEVIEKEEELLIIFNSSISEVPQETTFNIHLSDDKELKRTILDSTYYGSRCSFADSFTIDKFYSYRARFDRLGISFDDALTKLKENEAAIKEYNQIHNGRSVSFIEDYYSCVDVSTELYSYIQSYKEQEKIKKKFNDEILSNPLRSKFYEQYLRFIPATSDSTEKYCITHLQELDDFIKNQLHTEYIRLKAQYPYGVEYCEKYNHPYGYTNEEAVVENKDELPQWNKSYKKYKDFERRYPIGLPAFENFNSYDDGKNSAGLTIEEIAECESDIAQFQSIGARYSQSLQLSGQDLIRRVCQFMRLTQAIKGWDDVKGIPYYYFYHYYPKRFTDVSRESEKARRIVWDFKDGKLTTPSVSALVSDKLNNTFGRYDLSELTLVCIPASTRVVNVERYEAFAREVCRKTGMRNGFPKIQITKEKIPAHLSESHETEPAEYSFDSYFFKGAKVILFDDVVTKGRSMAQFKQLLSNLGAEVICALSIGRTYSDYYGEHRNPHPYSGIL